MSGATIWLVVIEGLMFETASATMVTNNVNCSPHSQAIDPDVGKTSIASDTASAR